MSIIHKKTCKTVGIRIFQLSSSFARRSHAREEFLRSHSGSRPKCFHWREVYDPRPKLWSWKGRATEKEKGIHAEERVRGEM